MADRRNPDNSKDYRTIIMDHRQITSAAINKHYIIAFILTAL